MNVRDCFVGVDVGTGSVRAGVFDGAGALLGHASREIATWREAGGIVEQSSEDIWRAACATVRSAIADASILPERVAGLGFDATCSMAVVAEDGAPLAVGLSGDPIRNVIVWMDHRAIEQARAINQTGHAVLNYVGGSISPEMQVPKLLWLSQHRADTFNRAAHFFDLSDYLAWRATGSLARSLCTVVCKWTYLGHERRWDRDFFRLIGLGVLADENFRRIGTEVADIATPCGEGLRPDAARDLGLPAGIAVGTPLIDAHAGGVGSLGAPGTNITRDLALVAGTSACTMTVARDARFVHGVWGPYFGAMLPGYWLNEGGQSAFGAALDHVLAMHPATPDAASAATARKLSLPAYLEQLAIDQAGSPAEASLLADRIHVVPEFLGNRSPEADPESTATISGLRLETDVGSLVGLFVAALRGLAYGTAEIVEALERGGQAVSVVTVSGGAAQSPLLRRILADATQKTIARSGSPEPVLLGAAMLGAVAGGTHRSLAEAAATMVSRGETLDPMDGKYRVFHDRGRQAYRRLKECERANRTGAS
jgi:D-ribulokinase